MTASTADSGFGTSVDVLDGFTIRGGNAEDAPPFSRGGGFLCVSDVTVRDCTFVGNAASIGGGVYCGPSCCVTQVQLIRCSIVGNRADREGGGVYTGDSDLLLDSYRIHGNSAGEMGGGVMFGNDNNSRLVNSASSRGGLPLLLLRSDLVRTRFSRGAGLSLLPCRRETGVLSRRTATLRGRSETRANPGVEPGC